MDGARNIRLTIEYKGTAYSGWQYQPRLRTIQGELENALKKLTGKEINIIGAGRTDSGVHAMGQVANFHINHNLPVKKYRDALNYYLPNDILICDAIEVAPDFHSRFDAGYRRYQYRLGFKKSALLSLSRWEIDFKPDMKNLDWAAEQIRGEHDFETFCVVSSRKKDNRCLIYESLWKSEKNMLMYGITANRFLHSMIRSLVGLMLDVGRGAITRDEFKNIFVSGNHTILNRVAPAHGLYFMEVGY